MRDELNVVDLANLADTGELIELSVKPNFRALGRRFGGSTQAVAAAIAALDPAALVARPAGRVRRGHRRRRAVELTGDDVIVTETPRSGWAVSSGGPDTVALDLELTHELRLLGLIRDVVRSVQEARKDAGLEVTDRIELAWQVGGSPEPAEAIRTHTSSCCAARCWRSASRRPPDRHRRTGSSRDDRRGSGLRVWLRTAPATDRR